jgi:transposase-like protein
MPAPLDQRTKERAARLVGMGLTNQEAAGALGLHVSTVERLLRLSEYRKIAEDEKKRRESPAAEVARIIRDLIHDPDARTRERAAELYLRHKDIVDAYDVRLDADDEMLPGVTKHTVLHFPGAVDARPPDPNDRIRRADGSWYTRADEEQPPEVPSADAVRAAIEASKRDREMQIRAGHVHGPEEEPSDASTPPEPSF